ncbi:MAG: hypothetical protein JNK25_11315 [Phycisphaerae bacterium]|nr:hypothetical protein [Phycisphaerae bacterium]
MKIRLPALGVILLLGWCNPLSASATQPGEPAVRTPGAGAKVDLRPKFKAGQTHKFKLQMQASGRDESAELGTQTQSISQEIGIALKVKTADREKGATLDLVYESIKIRLKPPGGGDEIEFDSTKKAGDDPIAMILQPIVGLTLQLTADKDGNITGLETAGLSGVAAGLAGQFTGADVIKNLIGPIFTLRRGGGEAAVGESWTNEDRIDAPWGKINLITTNTLKSHKANIADIDIKGAFSLDAASAGGQVPSIKDSLLTGSARWNTETGMLTEMNTRQKLSMESAASGKSIKEMTLKVTAVK